MYIKLKELQAYRIKELKQCYVMMLDICAEKCLREKKIRMFVKDRIHMRKKKSNLQILREIPKCAKSA